MEGTRKRKKEGRRGGGKRKKVMEAGRENRKEMFYWGLAVGVDSSNLFRFI